MSQWYAIRTATRREYDANQALYEAGIPFFVPSDTHDRKLKGEVEIITRPRYPGYGFAHCTPEQLTDKVLPARFVHNVVRYTDTRGDQHPLPVPPQVVATLFATQWEGKFDRRSNEYSPARGDKVKLTGGKWAAMGYLYEVTSVTADKRRVLLKYMYATLEEDVANLVAA